MFSDRQADCQQYHPFPVFILFLLMLLLFLLLFLFAVLNNCCCCCCCLRLNDVSQRIMVILTRCLFQGVQLRICADCNEMPLFPQGKLCISGKWGFFHFRKTGGRILIGCLSSTIFIASCYHSRFPFNP